MGNREDKYSVTRCKTSGDFVRAVSHQGGTVVHGSRHDIAHDADGKGACAIPRHNGDLAPGTRGSIKKMLLLLGFFVLFGACVCLMASRGNVSNAGVIAVATATISPQMEVKSGCLPTLSAIFLLTAFL